MDVAEPVHNRGAEGAFATWLSNRRPIRVTFYSRDW